MDLYLTGKRALVTGASKGIGRATAIALAEEGCDLVLVSRDANALNLVADRVHAAGAAHVDVVPADLSQRSEVARLAAAAGPIDILVNNAGAIPFGRCTDFARRLVGIVAHRAQELPDGGGIVGHLPRHIGLHQHAQPVAGADILQPARRGA